MELSILVSLFEACVNLLKMKSFRSYLHIFSLDYLVRNTLQITNRSARVLYGQFRRFQDSIRTCAVP